MNVVANQAIDEASPPLRGALWRITLGGSLAMVYGTCVGSPVTAAFFRDLGASEFQFGLLGGVPMMMLFLQFVGAFFTGRVANRKPWFIALAMVGRMVYLPVAFLPLLFPEVPLERWIIPFIGLVVLSTSMNHLVTPLWFSWMADVIPHRILNRYWGGRQRWMTLVWSFTFLTLAAFVYLADWLTAVQAFAVIVAVGVAAGVVDILLFLRVPEPGNEIVRDRGLRDIFFEPLKHASYRRVIVFTCAFGASTMLAAAFMQIYVVKGLGVPLWQASLIWTTVGLGSAVVSRAWGRTIDRFGHRPVMLLAVMFKPFIALTFLLITERSVMWVLMPVFFFDSMANSAHGLSVNGFMIKMAPRQNRSMFVAAVMALSGLSAGVAAILGGLLLRSTEAWELDFAGRIWNHYHLLFAASFVLRILCIPLAMRVREPASSSTTEVVSYLRGSWPLRIFTFPVGLYQRWSPLSGDNDKKDGTA